MFHDHQVVILNLSYSKCRGNYLRPFRKEHFPPTELSLDWGLAVLKLYALPQRAYLVYLDVILLTKGDCRLIHDLQIIHHDLAETELPV